MSPALNGSSTLELCIASKIRNGIMFDFYLGLPHMYMNRVHFTQIKERVAASLGDSLFAEALSCVVKAGHVQNKVATSCV